MIATHKTNKDKIIHLEAKRGQPLVDRLGLVKIIKGDFKHLEKISIKSLKQNFNIGVCV